MKVLIAGGTGFIGRKLVDALLLAGHQVTVLTRNTKKGHVLPEPVALVHYNPLEPGLWKESVADHEVIINLAGLSIFRLWSESARKKIIESRTVTTRNLVDALTLRKGSETHFFNISGIGYYGSSGDKLLDEDSPSGAGFLAQLAVEWESAALQAREHGVRVVLLRLGNVLGRGGGVLRKLTMVTRLYLGGRWGNGNQWLSWIHEKDIPSAFLFMMENRDIRGPVNLCSPNQVRNREIMSLLRTLLKKPAVVPVVPGWLLRALTGEFASVFLSGQRVMPRILLDSGFIFKYPLIDDALKDLLNYPE
jgi:uncharacterized protein (TIGR01777 family)